MAQLPLDHIALFNARLIQRSLVNVPIVPAHQQLLADWAQALGTGAAKGRTEQQIRGAFTQKIFGELLGYKTFGAGANYTLADENDVGRGRADVVLGQFGPQGKQTLVPVELKGPATANLDLMMPGRYKSPVQQVWEYAMDLPNAKFLLLTNMREIRLYAVGHTRRVYERFDLLAMADSPAQYQRLMLLLGADKLLGGHTLALLNESGQIEKQITRELYADYKRWRIQLITALAQANDLAPGALITPAQKLLDRVLFVAFAQQRGLLPADTLKSVNKGDGWVILPKYDHYKALFRAVDKGLPERGIPPYNGGLFAPDAVLDTLLVPNAACDMFMEFGKYDFGGEVSVNVLGHIFEQSITGMTSAYRGGFYRLFTQHVETLPIPKAPKVVKSKLTTLAKTAQTAAESRRDEIAKFGRAALRDLVPGGLSNLTLTKGVKAAALPAAWQTDVPTFGDLTAELKKRFKRDLNLQERNDWDGAVAQARQKVAALTATIIQAEREIDTLVYQLFALTPDEIRLVEASTSASITP